MTYLRSMVTAPRWMEDFTCLAGDCEDTCCKDWNIEVDAEHAERWVELNEPLLEKMLLRAKLRRAGKKVQNICRLELLDQPNRRCLLLNAEGKCRLQLKYGAEMLCDTCYFFPRLFRQIDGETFMTASFACPEVARRVIHAASPEFVRFETEIDPGAEWLEISLIPNAETGELLRKRDAVIREAVALLTGAPCEHTFFGTDLLTEREPEEIIRRFTRAFDWAGENRERGFAAVAAMLPQLAAGERDALKSMARYYREALEKIYLPFLAEHPFYEKNLLVHLVFSDMLTQFDVYQNENRAAEEILRHEAEWLTLNRELLRLLQVHRCIVSGTASEVQFLDVLRAGERDFWHYPIWLHRCTERLRTD